MDTPITRAEHEEFKARMDEANRQQVKRIEALENDVRQIGTLTTSVEKLALSMESMVKEQANQGKRLEVLEDRDGKMWRRAIGYVVTAILGIIVGSIFKQIGL